MYLTPTNKHWIVDIEGNGLKPTIVWVVCVANAITEEKHTFTSYEKIKQFFQEKCAEGCYFVGHNFIGYDGPVLNRLVGTRISINRMVDTFLLSMLYSPSLGGG